MAAPTPKIRPAQESDMPQIQQMLAHYVENTVVTFRHNPTTLESELEQLRDVNARGLPYLVAVEPPAPLRDSSQTSGSEERVLGSVSVHPFRGAKEGYVHTVELSIFVRLDATRQGRVGSPLLGALLAALREQNERARSTAGEHAEGAPAKGEIHQVIACMAADDRDPERDAAITRFYERWGFVERGGLKKVGWKFGRWIDTRYLQLEL